jgi:hypothetical protein
MSPAKHRLSPESQLFVKIIIGWKFLNTIAAFYSLFQEICSSFAAALSLLRSCDDSSLAEVGILDSIPFEQVTQIFSELSQRIGDSLQKSRANKACVEIGVEFGIENGQLVALIARASGKTNIKISIEWNPLDLEVTSQA